MFISNNHKNQSNKTSPICKKLVLLRESIPLLTGCIINPGHGKNQAPDFNSIYKKTNIQ